VRLQTVVDAAQGFEGSLGVRVEDKRQGPPKLHDLPSHQAGSRTCGVEIELHHLCEREPETVNIFAEKRIFMRPDPNEMRRTYRTPVRAQYNGRVTLHLYAVIRIPLCR
jgi:hypothetical protein